MALPEEQNITFVDIAPDQIDQPTWDQLISQVNDPALRGSGLSVIGKPFQSTNFVEGSTGWRINSNGDAEFNSVVIRGIPDVQTFSSSGTWTKPSSGSIAYVQLWGGGGSGGARTTWVASGGGGGGFSELWVPLASLGDTETVTIGAGGAAVSGSNDGNTGGDSTFGSHITAYGGGGGSQGASGASGGGGGSSLSAGTDANGTVIGTGGSPTGGDGADGATGAGDTDAVPAINGAGGGAGDIDSNSGTGGGSSELGGGGGGGAGPSGGGSGGSSVRGGAGGLGVSHASNNAGAGTQPAGGGGGKYGASGTSGAGGDGKCIVTVF